MNVCGDRWRDDERILGRDRLRVEALDVAALGRERAAVGVSGFGLAA